MVSLFFNDYYYFNIIVFITIYIYIFFLKLNTNKKNNNNKNTLVKNITLNNTNFLLKVFLIFYTLYFICVYTIFGNNNVIFFEHFSINNFTITTVYLFLIMGFLIYVLIKNLIIKTDTIKSYDYVFSIINIIIYLPILFFVNNILIFLFFLEFISLILFYKLVSSKIWFKDNNNFKISLNNNIPQNYINMIFFQYWVTFFSTIYIIYFYINNFLIFGTSDWLIIQFLQNYKHFNNIGFVKTNILIYIFIFSIFLKLGVAPFHLFKIEVYKGLPYITIFFYTFFYFTVLFLFFLLLIFDFLYLYSNIVYNLIFVFLCLGSFIVVIQMFDVFFLKAFFAYSTIINSLGFLIIILSAI